MFRPHFNIVFLGGRGVVVFLVNRALEGRILKLNIQRAFFFSFLSKIVVSLKTAATETREHLTILDLLNVAKCYH